MSPKLVVVGGGPQGAAFPLTEDETAIGREPGSRVLLVDPLISRHHSVVRREGDRLTLVDLESTNGTFVNDVPVKEKTLEHGDRIRVGGCELIFLQQDELPASPATVEVEERERDSVTTREIRWEDALHFRPDVWTTSSPLAPRLARDLGALLKLCRSVSSSHGLEALEQEVLACVFEVLPAERGAIVLTEGGDAFGSLFGRHRDPKLPRPVRISRTIVGRVLNEAVAVLVNRVRESEAHRDAESLVTAGTESVLTVPLVFLGRTVGAIYLDTTDARSPFDESHLHVLTAIAGLTAGALESAQHLERLKLENQSLRDGFRLDHHLVGECPPMKALYKLVGKLAPTDSTVLILGESGTGKELVARALHENSRRAAKPFVAINCATLTEFLLESELFGHEKGAFTGAVARKPGKLELADGGTVFLDEVGELTSTLQAKLLRVLQEHEFERVGGTRAIRVDIRWIAATNRDLREEIRRGTFRGDLYYRLNVVSLEVPPLRERREDIPLLASYFVSKYGKKTHRLVRGVSPEARSALCNYDWPGNVRELENALERAVVLGSTNLILPEDLPETVLEREPPQEGSSYHAGLVTTKKELVRKALEQANGNVTAAARILGVNANYLHRLMKNLGLRTTQNE